MRITILVFCFLVLLYVYYKTFRLLEHLKDTYPDEWKDISFMDISYAMAYFIFNTDEYKDDQTVQAYAKFRYLYVLLIIVVFVSMIYETNM